jgi:hypothetical protein
MRAHITFADVTLGNGLVIDIAGRSGPVSSSLTVRRHEAADRVEALGRDPRGAAFAAEFLTRARLSGRSCRPAWT